MRGVRYLLLAVMAFSALASLSGCGGSGGDDNKNSTRAITASVDFSHNVEGGIPGVSVRVQVLDANDNVVDGNVIDNTSNTAITTELNAPTSGEIRIHAELYNGISGSGTIVGTIDSAYTSLPTGTIKLSVGETPVAVRVTPDGLSLPVGSARTFYAAAQGASGALTFANPAAGTFSFEALGSIASVTPSGSVSALAQGTGTIRATHVPTGSIGSAALTVTPNNVSRSKWTVMVYMNAANDLYTFSTLNMNQLETVAGNSDVRYVVQWKLSRSLYSDALFNGTRRYLVKSDSSDNIGSQLVQDMGTGVDMGSAQTLNDFTKWAEANYPADRYALVVWNHGNGWRRSLRDNGRGVSYDDELGTSIQTWELGSALSGVPQLDILSWDSSLMQMMEVAYEVREHAKYVVGSEESPPGEGLPYDRIFGVFRDNPSASTATLTKAFVDGMLAVPAYNSRKITQSTLDTSKLPALATAIDNLAQVLIDNRTSLTTIIPAVRTSAQAYSQSGPRIYRDLYDVCSRLATASADASVITACQNVQSAITAALVNEGHNSNSANSHGVSIDFSDGATFTTSLTDYRRTKFGMDTRWDEFLIQAP